MIGIHEGYRSKREKSMKDNMEKNNLTHGNVTKRLVYFALPFLLSSFLQTFYGMADLFVIGMYNGSASTSAVSIGSQVMHMLTVMIIGLAMGTTVHVGRAIGAGDKRETSQIVGTTVVFFMGLAVILTLLLYVMTGPIVKVMMTPTEAVEETAIYLKICFVGLLFIMAYNVISGIFRGVGDSKSPMYFVAIACVVNIVLDFLLVGRFHMGAAGAAFATVCGQAVSVIVSLYIMKKKDIGFEIKRKDLRMDTGILRKLLLVGVPISMQDGLIQIAFIVITVIANRRGLVVSSAVGIVEKIICFLFMVPSAFLSALSAVTAQNMGAGKPERARQSLRIALTITTGYAVLVVVYCHFLPASLVGLFTKDTLVLTAGCQYLLAYSIDTIFASVHFCFSGYFCGDQKSIISFIHNILSVMLIRIPGAYFASIFFPDTLFPMGLAAPMGSLFSIFICLGFYKYYRKKEKMIAI